MSTLTHDPEFPFVFRFSEGDKPTAKFRTRVDAENFADNYYSGSIVDTTPAPPLPTEPGIYRARHWAPTLFYILETSGVWKVHWSDGAISERTPTGGDVIDKMKRLEDA